MSRSRFPAPVLEYHALSIENLRQLRGALATNAARERAVEFNHSRFVAKPEVKRREVRRRCSTRITSK